MHDHDKEGHCQIPENVSSDGSCLCCRKATETRNGQTTLFTEPTQMPLAGGTTGAN